MLVIPTWKSIVSKRCWIIVIEAKRILNTTFFILNFEFIKNYTFDGNQQIVVRLRYQNLFSFVDRPMKTLFSFLIQEKLLRCIRKCQDQLATIKFPQALTNKYKIALPRVYETYMHIQVWLIDDKTVAPRTYKLINRFLSATQHNWNVTTPCTSSNNSHNPTLITRCLQ